MGKKSFRTVTALVGAMAIFSVARAQDSASSARLRQALEKVRQLRSGAGATAAATTAPADGTLEHFTVNAQYRGAVKKSFMDLGGGSVRCRTLAPDRYEVLLEAKVRHPEKENETIEFSIRREFTVNGSKIKVLAEDNTMNETAKKYKEKILSSVCLAYLIKWRSPQSNSGAMNDQSYAIGDRTYTLSYAVAKGGEILEVSLADNDGKVAKFFLKPSERGVRPIDRFRIFTRDDVVISFVVS